MKDSCGRIWWLIQKLEAIVVGALLCLPGLLHAQTPELAPSKVQANANLAKPQYAAASQTMVFVPQPKIPNVTGFTVLEAQRIVAGHFTLAAADRRSKISLQDVITDQLPKPDTTAKAGAEIEIWVKQRAPASNYSPLPPKLLPVPNLVGHTRESAIEILNAIGFSVGKMGTQESEEGDGIVLSQYPTPPATAAPKSPVSFTVSKQIQRTLTVTGPASCKPGDTLTFVAHLDPPFPSTRYQFTFGDGITSNWDFNPARVYAFPADGNYEVRAFAAWDGGKAESEPLTVTVHSIGYVATLTPSPTQQTEGKAIQFHAELDPAAENVHYVFDFGDKTKLQPSDSPDLLHVYSRPGSYTTRVSISLPDHEHKIMSAPTSVTIVAAEPPLVVKTGRWLNENKHWIIGGVVLLSCGFALGGIHDTWQRNRRRLARSKIELRPVIPSGKLRVRVQGRLWSRIESLRGRNG